MSQRPKSAKEIFFAAIETEGAQRGAFLDGACAGDGKLREHVEALLRTHDEPDSLLDSPRIDLGLSDAAVGGQCAKDDLSIAEQTGATIGRYKLLELIGEGGFGNVYLAEQQQPVRRQVALKVIKLGMDTRQVIARFDAERQALALMDHPHIAKVLDAGATETGRPYFAMDLVQGVPITEYCDAHNLAAQERLQLFIGACSAVQHAHQKGVIHRDLKPANVLVTQRDGKPIPKIIDFGVAKAIDQRLTEKTLYTSHGQLIGTPEYMSPEQATFGEADVDTRSDVYSLGVLLYELLIGATPFDAKQLRSRGYDEICRVIRENDPPTPSKRLSTLGDAVAEISKHRDVRPESLGKLLRGDLDWIVMKCLEKDRTRRYETVHSLARDIERHLADEPVRARPPSTAYRLKKYVRKHRMAVTAAIAVLAALAVGLARSEHQRRVATKNLELARSLARDVIQPAMDRMYDFPFAQEHQKQVLENARDYYVQIVEQADDDRAPRRELAGVHRRLGELAFWACQNPETDCQRSLAILNGLLRDSPQNVHCLMDVSTTRDWLAFWYANDLRLHESIRQLNFSIGIVEDLAARFPSREEYRHALAHKHTQVGGQLARAGRLPEAETHHRHAVAESDLEAGTGVRSRENLVRVLMRQGRFGEAEQLLQEALKIDQRETAPFCSPPQTGWTSNTVGHAHCLHSAGQFSLYANRLEDAEKYLRQAIDPIAKWTEFFPHTTWLSYYLGWWRHDLAETLTLQGRLEEAEAERRQSLATWESAKHADAAIFSQGRAVAHYRLAELLYQTGRTEQAREQFTEALAIMEDISRRRPEEAFCQSHLICLLANCPDPTLRDPQRAVALAQQVLPESAGHYWRYLALAQYRSGDWQAAAESTQRVMDLRQGGDAYDQFLSAMAHWQLGRTDEARERYDRAQQAIEAKGPLLYENIGVLAFERIRQAASDLVDQDRPTQPEDKASTH